jgi:CSLREA domain-containing protein
MSQAIFHSKNIRRPSSVKALFGLLILSGLSACLLSFLQPSAHAAATFVVNSTSDTADANVGDGVCADASGGCTLRAAIQEANAAAGTDTINFQIGSGLKTIVMTSDLPIISDPVVIDGTTQPGYTNVPVIELNGNDVQFHAGLHITAGNSTIRSLVMNRFHTSAIALLNNGGNRITGCYIGTDASGTQDLSGNQDGITVFQSSNNIIGGTTPSERNVISGNGTGIMLGGSNNVVQGNYIGTNAFASASVGNSFGIRPNDGSNNTIGGTAARAGNVISGNFSDGMWVGTGWTVQGNFIGTNSTGTIAVPNFWSGLLLVGSSNTIGGTTPEARNVISGNNEAGINIVDSATSNVVQGNYIGVGADGSRAIPNSNGVGNSSGGVFIRYAAGNTIGGTAPGTGNTIAYNGTGGVIVVPFNTNVPNTDSRNTIRRNSIYSNGGLGIDLVPFGVTLNDAGDSDEGREQSTELPRRHHDNPGRQLFDGSGHAQQQAFDDLRHRHLP